MDKSGGEEAMRKRHTTKQQQSQSASSGGRNLIPLASGLNASRGDLEFSEKSKKEKVRSLSAVDEALSMGCRVSHSHKPTKKFKLPRKFLKDCNGVDHASVPRKIRSAVKKRGRESIFGDSEKVNHRMNGMESPQKDGKKKSKKQRTPGLSTRQVSPGPITKDEEEVVETLYALAGMFPADNASNAIKSELGSESLPENSTVLQDQEESQSANVTVEASGATQDGGERSPRGCKKISFLNETNGQEQTDFPESAKFLVATHSTAPKTNLQAVPMMVKSESSGNVALHDSELLSLEMGLNVPAQPQISHIGRQSDVGFQTVGSVDYKQEQQHLIKYQKETEGLALWPGLSPIASAGITGASYMQSSSAKAQDWLNTAIGVSKQELVESCSSGGKISEIITQKKSWKRCAAHVHISHLIRSLEVSKRQVGKEHELCPQTTVHQGSKCGVLTQAHNLNWMRSGNSRATRTVYSATTSNSRETKNGFLQQGLYNEKSQAPPTPGVYDPQKQCFNFLSLSTRGSELKVNESFNKGESKLEPYSKQQLPYFQSLHQQQQQHHGLMPIQSSPYASTFLDQLPVAGPQVQLQQPHYYGTLLRGTHYSSTVSYKQQHQSFWAVQLAAQGGSSSVNCSIVRAQYPDWQSGRHDSSVARVILPHSPASASLETLGSKITSISEQHPFSFGANGQDNHLASSVCDESKADDMGPQPPSSTKSKQAVSTATPTTGSPAPTKVTSTTPVAEPGKTTSAAAPGKKTPFAAAEATERSHPPKRAQPPAYIKILAKMKKRKVVQPTQLEIAPTNQGNPTSSPPGAAALELPPPPGAAALELPPPPLVSSTPPPSTDAFGSSPGCLWEKGVTDDMICITKAPKRFSHTSLLSRDDLEELGRIEENVFKCAALMQSLATLKTRHSKLADELQASREETQKTHQELLASQDSNASLRQELQTALDTAKSAHSTLETARKKNLMLTLHFSEMKTLLKKSELKCKEAESRLHRAESQLRVAKEDDVLAGEALATAMEESFKNTLEQIRCLNPRINFNTTGMHFQAYVDDGKLVLPSPPEYSVVPMDEDPTQGEEVISTQQADVQVQTPGE